MSPLTKLFLMVTVYISTFFRTQKLKLFHSEVGFIGNAFLSPFKWFPGQTFIISVFAVYTHRYGREGMATKKFDDTCLIFDWELLDHLSEPPSLKNYDAALITFLQLINSLHTGENKILF